MKWAKEACNYSTYDVSHKNPKPKKSCSLQTWRLGESFEVEQLSSAVNAGVLPAQRHVHVLDFCMNHMHSPSSKGVKQLTHSTQVYEYICIYCHHLYASV